MLNKDAKKPFEYHCGPDNVICPFMGKKCFKLSRVGFGVCSFEHNGVFQIVCPSLFPREDIFKLIANKVLGCGEYEALSEVKIGNNFVDFILVERQRSDNYCAIEYQALDTTGNCRWLSGEAVKPFCINWKTTKKTILSQLLSEVPLFAGQKKKVVLVIQDTFSNYLGFSNEGFDSSDEIVLLTFHYDKNGFSDYRFQSISLGSLASAFLENQVDIEAIIRKRLD